jgi:hypothetical protein
LCKKQHWQIIKATIVSNNTTLSMAIAAAIAFTATVADGAYGEVVINGGTSVVGQSPTVVCQSSEPAPAIFGSGTIPPSVPVDPNTGAIVPVINCPASVPSITYTYPATGPTYTYPAPEAAYTYPVSITTYGYPYLSDTYTYSTFGSFYTYPVVRNVYPYRGPGIVNSTLVRPVLVNPRIRNSTLINPVIINGRQHQYPK